MSSSSITRLIAGASALSLVSAASFDLPITFRNSYATVDVEVGTPREKHALLFDTGSATAWMVDGECAETCKNLSGYVRKPYNITASSTGSEMGTSAEIEYTGGLTGGYGVSDQFQINSTSWNQTFMAANESSWYWTAADGFLGLAFSTIADAGAETMVETMMQAKLLDEPRFSIYYGKEFNDTNGAPGEGVLTIGKSEEEKYVDGDMTWLPLQRIDGDYQVWRSVIRTVTGTKQGANSSSTPVTTPLYQSNSWGVFDTGGGHFIVPPLMVDAIYRSIGMNWTAIQKGDHIPLCTEFNSTWSVSFEFGSDDAHTSTFSMTGDQFAHPGFANREDACWPPFDGGDVNGFFLFGTRVLHQFYSVFDFGAFDVADYNASIGLGALKKEYKP